MHAGALCSFRPASGSSNNVLVVGGESPNSYSSVPQKGALRVRNSPSPQPGAWRCPELGAPSSPQRGPLWMRLPSSSMGPTVTSSPSLLLCAGSLSSTPGRAPGQLYPGAQHQPVPLEPCWGKAGAGVQVQLAPVSVVLVQPCFIRA